MKKKLTRHLDNDKYFGWVIFCPGCRGYHVLDKRWNFNGNIEKPSFSPSYKETSMSYKGYQKICHFFIKDGKIEFLKDCSHDLADQIVDLPEKFDW